MYVNDRNPISTRITRHHTFNKRSKPFQRCYYESVYTKPSKNVNGVISTTSYLIPSIAQGHFNYEYQTTVAECDFTDTNLIVIPYNQKGNVGHWSIFAYTQKNIQYSI